MKSCIWPFNDLQIMNKFRTTLWSCNPTCNHAMSHSVEGSVTGKAEVQHSFLSYPNPTNFSLCCLSVPRTAFPPPIFPCWDSRNNGIHGGDSELIIPDSGQFLYSWSSTSIVRGPHIILCSWCCCRSSCQYGLPFAIFVLLDCPVLTVDIL